MEKVEVLPNGCWRWTASKTKFGYGRFYRGNPKRTVMAHRVGYELLVGPIPRGKTLDHTCHNADPDCNLSEACPHRACVNPAHLEPVTMKRNILRGKGHAAKNAKRKTCRRGHPLSGGNLFRSADGKRQCRICMRERNRKTKANPARQESQRQYRKSEERQKYDRAYREQHREQNRAYQRDHYAQKRAAEGKPPRRKGPSPEALEGRRASWREYARRKREAAT